MRSTRRSGAAAVRASASWMPLPSCSIGRASTPPAWSDSQRNRRYRNALFTNTFRARTRSWRPTCGTSSNTSPVPSNPQPTPQPYAAPAPYAYTPYAYAPVYAPPVYSGYAPYGGYGYYNGYGAPSRCYTNEGYGRYRPCSAN